MIDNLSRYLLGQARRRGLSQTEFAKRAGLSREMLNRIINGKVTEPSQSTLAGLAYALDEHPRALSRKLMEGMPFATPYFADPGFDDSGFVRDVSFPENSPVSCSQRFTKIWKIQNLGNAVWEKRSLRCMDDLEPFYRKRVHPDGRIEFVPETRLLIPEQDETTIPRTMPGDTVDIAVAFVAPEIPGSFVSLWRMFDTENKSCFPNYVGLTCMVQVVSCG